MKILKKIFLYGLFILATACPIVFGAIKFQNPSSSPVKAAPLEQNIFDIISITKENQVITEENLLKINNEKYITTNGSLSIHISPLEREYNITTTLDNFEILTDEINLTKNAETNTYPGQFDYNGKTYYLSYSTGISSKILYIYTSRPSPSVRPVLQLNITDSGSPVSNSIASATENTEQTQITISLTTCYTWRSSASDTTFSVVSGTYNETLNLLRPKVNFANASNPIIMFDTFEVDDLGTPYPKVDTIEREQQFNNVQIDFIDNSYTENNPLYFNINYNGFIYNFKMYSKVYEENRLLFVNYIDENIKKYNEANQGSTEISERSEITYLATLLDAAENLNNITNADENNLSLLFNKTGRYEIEFYDSTYVCKMNNPNYYSTSFYIVDETATTFENIYMIAQTLDDEHNPIEYIVSTSTLNNSAKVTVKNLTNLESSESLDQIIDKVEVIKAIFGASDNEPIHTFYSVEEILTMLDENGDLNFTFDDDAYYQVHIYPKDTSLEEKMYSFTIVKQAKTSMTIDNEKFEATEPYKSIFKDYISFIPSQMSIQIKFTTTPSSENTTLSKIYINEYSIMYGMQRVDVIRKPSVSIDGEGKEVVVTGSMTIEFYGVGDMIVNVQFNGKTTTYELNSEENNNSLTFAEYGTYNFHLVDSMGTVKDVTFNLEKSLNVSAIVLIVLSSVIALAIILFILIARAKVKTR